MGTDGYRVPARKILLGTDGYRVPARKKILGTDGYQVPGKFSLMPTPGLGTQNPRSQGVEAILAKFCILIFFSKSRVFFASYCRKF